jgi:hypothetical protein
MDVWKYTVSKNACIKMLRWTWDVGYLATIVHESIDYAREALVYVIFFSFLAIPRRTYHGSYSLILWYSERSFNIDDIIVASKTAKELLAYSNRFWIMNIAYITCYHHSIASSDQDEQTLMDLNLNSSWLLLQVLLVLIEVQFVCQRQYLGTYISKLLGISNNNLEEFSDGCKSVNFQS